MENLEFSRQTVREFTDNVVWREMIATLKERRDMYEKDFMRLNPFTEGLKFAHAQAAINEIDYFLTLPEIMVREVTRKNKDEEEARDD